MTPTSALAAPPVSPSDVISDLMELCDELTSFRLAAGVLDHTFKDAGLRIHRVSANVRTLDKLAYRFRSLRDLLLSCEKTFIDKYGERKPSLADLASAEVQRLQAALPDAQWLWGPPSDELQATVVWQNENARLLALVNAVKGQLSHALDLSRALANGRGPVSVDSTIAAGSDREAEGDPGASPRPKKSSRRGDANVKLIAALLKHHEYSANAVLKQEPIANNKLARKAGVANSSATEFFKRHFKGYPAYRGTCRDLARLLAALKLLNQDFAPWQLYQPESDRHSPEDDM